MKIKLLLTLSIIGLLQYSAFADTIKFAQVTDVHYIAKDKYKTEVLKETVKDINKQNGLSFVVFTGDNLDSPKAEYLPDFIDIINKLDIPYYIVIGNHDVFKNGGLSKKQYLEIVKENNIFYKYKNPNYVFKKDGFVFIVVDGAKEVIPGTNGYYKQDTLAWLDKQLNKYSKKPVIIFQHFPVVEPKQQATHMVYKKEDYLKVIDKYDNIVSIVSGHFHSNFEQMRNGVYHISSPTLLSNPPVYKIITADIKKGYLPMVYTELKEVNMPEKE